MKQKRRDLVPGATSLGLPIGLKAFRMAVVDYLGRMELGREMTDEDFVTMTRLWNTIVFGQLDRKTPVFRRYSAAFFPAYIERVSKALDARATKGMALYSKKHDLYIGGVPHARSQYKIRAERIHP